MTTPTERRDLEICEVTDEAEGVVGVSFRDPAGADLPAWEPGAHIEIQLPSGLHRQYSLCSEPDNRSRYTVAVLREEAGRGGSRELHDIAAPGLVLSVRLPRNDFALVEADSYVFIGGGIGITPLIPMVAAAHARGAEWQLVYGGRTATTMAYREVLAEYGERVDVCCEDERGYPDLATILKAAPAGAHVYTCGPGAMIDAVAAEHARHDHLGPLHFERFSAAGPVDTSGDTFEVELAKTGATIQVPADVPILEAVREVLPDQPFSCEEGYCGECETTVLEGRPDHRDDYLTPEEQEANEVMMICVSRCLGKRLVLDL